MNISFLTYIQSEVPLNLRIAARLASFVVFCAALILSCHGLVRLSDTTARPGRAGLTRSHVQHGDEPVDEPRRKRTVTLT